MVNGTLINYYYLCHRKLWLHANSIRMEHTSDTVYEGKLISETTYTDRAAKYTELEIGSVKIDFYDPVRKIVHEVKKTNKVEAASEWQLKYYLLTLQRNGIEGTTGILEYPKLKKTQLVKLEQDDVEELEQVEKEIKKLLDSDKAPPLLNKPLCKKCSFYDFCYAG